MDIITTGKAFSEGMARGPAFVYVPDAENMSISCAIQKDQVDHELKQLESSTQKLIVELDRLEKHVEREIDKDLSKIFKAHKMMLCDPVMKTEMVDTIERELVSAGSAVKLVFNRWIARFDSMNSEIMRQKKDDLQDLMTRLLGFIAEREFHPLANVPDGCVVVAKNLQPSDTVYLARQSVAAVIIEHGGLTSHATLFCREISLPCIGQIPDFCNIINNDDIIIVDTFENKIKVNPDNKNCLAFDKALEEYKKQISGARKKAVGAALTLDKKHILVMSNIGNRIDAENSVLNNADGVGLLRLEKIYMTWSTPPTTALLFNELKSILEPVINLPVIIRLLDIGADKLLPYIDAAIETNPALGCRGVRMLLKYPRLLETQLYSLIELSQAYDLSVLIPMVTTPDDIISIKGYIEKCSSDLGLQPRFKLGAMIETPAAALSAQELAEHVDFISFGTNDLTQYTFAADRENAEVNNYFDDTNNAIFRLLKIAADDVQDTPMAICGELATRTAYTGKLLQCGIQMLSVPPNVIPEIKEAIRNSDTMQN